MLLRLKKVLITGATGDIGSAICKVFLENGATLCLTSTSASDLQNLKNELLREYKDALIYCCSCNLSNEDDIINLVKEANKLMGGIDVLVGNAGVVNDCLTVRMNKKNWDNVININLTANFLLSRECLKIMVRNSYGKIINISSIVGITGNIGQANYSASKAGLISMTKSIALEYAGRGITANCIAPGFIDSKMTETLKDDKREYFLNRIPMKRYGTPFDVANACLFLASNLSDYITGETILVDGGLLMK